MRQTSSTLFGRLGLGLMAVALASCVLAGENHPVNPPVDFARDIRPILSDKCFSCHGPDQEHREAELRLDRRDGLFQREGVDQIVVPGQLEASELWRRIADPSADDRMPPADSEKSLTGQERVLVRRWIEEGAVWQDHWSFIPPVRPAVPDTHQAGGPRDAIDRFLLARLGPAGLQPSPAADPRTLIRRYSFDLLGLPPSRQEVEEFVNAYEQDSERACAELVDRLLQSPHFGERLAMFWLDLVRYADTVGYHGDQEHAISPYRDYVIQAFNDNMSFDRFTVEQLAGDLLPDASVDHKIASGYNRLLQTSHEGGVQQREYLAKYSADRVRNFGSVWLGLTLGCAECHDHKFDPISQRDFYRLAAVFADVDDLQTFRGGDTSPTRREPELDVLSVGERRRLALFEAERSELEGSQDPALVERIQELNRQMEDLDKQKRRTMITVARPARPIRVLARGDWMDDSGEVVQPGVPAVFARELAEPATRLSLARWLTADDHPLTSRVFVNRLWKLYFGRGLAGSLEDFGSQGEPPVHPELLDWLSAEFIDSGWDVKYIIRVIVLSRAYRQSSLVSAAARQHDPDNRLMARQARPRLEAELIRDNALAVSGLLVRSIGGRSVRPYQPEGYYQQLNFPKRNYAADRDDRQYRRGLYVHWQRSFLHPMLKAFDAPSREECSTERPVSNTPQGALVLLNDPTFLESARVFAARVLEEAGPGFEERLGWAWQEALSRDPNPRETAAVQRLYERDLAEFQADPRAAESLLKNGLAPLPVQWDKAELAAWTSVSRALFNLNEFITRN